MGKRIAETMNKTLIYIILAALLLMGFLYVISKTSNNRSKLTTEQQEILKIANNKASSLGYDVNNMKIIYDFDNALWHKYSDPEDPVFENIDFQAIHYGVGNKTTLGGTLIVVVDKLKKEVIWFQKGQ